MVSKKLLVIDDNPDMIRLISEIAEDSGFVVSSTTGADYFFSLYHADLDVIVLDLIMPGMDGIELLRFLAEKQCKAAIILMSGCDKRVLDTAKELGQAHGLRVIGILPKPYRVMDFQVLLEKATETDNVASSFSQEKAKPTVTEEELQTALNNGNFFLHYQPQAYLKSRRVYGVEALSRWQHPDKGLIFPDLFIDLAERSGLIRELTEQVLTRALKQYNRWRQKGINLNMSVNIPAGILSDLSFPNQIQELLDELNVPAKALLLEVTETGLIKEIKKSLDVLTRLRMKGVGISVDDFGTGYSGLQQAREIPATELKIDKSFVIPMMENDSARVIVHTALQIGQQLNMRVIAEGVETEEIRLALQEAGCRFGQGYLISRPLPPDIFEEWLKTADWNRVD
ncbi:MAG: EAL domain-containing response regulator [Acidobacteria bacterium]|nr:EAL domain-containing response regulator [Acidobacteriota bacterium]